MKSKYRFVARFTIVALALASWSTVAAQPSAATMYMDAREHLVEERFEQALRLFRRIVDEHPSSDEVEDAQYYVGYTLELMGRRDQAIRAYDEFLRNWPDSVRVENAKAHRLELIGQQPGGNSEVLEDVFSGSGSWELKRDAAMALAREGNLSGAAILEQIMRRESTGRQLAVVKILERHLSDPSARRILLLGLESSRSSSVQLRTLEALEPIAGDPEVAAAIERVLAGKSSSSVEQKAIDVASEHIDEPHVRRAVARALESENSSSVQMKACSVLSGHMLDPEVMPAVIRLFQTSTSSSVQLKALSSIEPDKDRLEAAAILREAITNNNSSSVQLKAIQIAGNSNNEEVRAMARAGLARSNSSSVQLQAVKAFAEGRNEAAASEAIEEMFQRGNVSTSVQLAALDALENHMDTPAAPQALSHALDSDNSTSVQLKALQLAVEHVSLEEVKAAILGLLGDSSTSTSVQLRAVRLLQEDIDEPEVRRIVSQALRPSNSTSVQLEAVESLSEEVDEKETRLALIRVLDREYSTSVVLKALDGLEDYAGQDSAVKEAFIRVMLDERISSTARVRAAESLVSSAGTRLKEQIADAMEDVIIRLARHRRSGHSDLMDDAFDVLEDVDPERAERLEQRYGNRRVHFLEESGRAIAEEVGLDVVLDNYDTLRFWADLVRGSRVSRDAASAEFPPQMVP
jgi:tetratricopeptide (TPR) repeat protein